MFLNALLLIGTSLAWASGYLFIGDADHGLPPLTASAAMSAIAALVLLPGVAFGLRRPLLQPLRTRLWVPLVMGLTAIALPNLSVVLAEDAIEPDMASLVGTTVPILTFLLTVFVTRQTVYSHLRLLGVFVALGGMVVFIGWRGLLSDSSEVHGIVIMMSGGLVFALNGILASYKARDLDECALAAWVVTFGAVAQALGALALESHEIVLPKADVLWSVVGEGIIGMGLAYMGYYQLLGRAGPYFASLYAYLVPLFGVVIAAQVLNERLTSAHLTGLGIVLLGLWLLTSRVGLQGPERAVAESGVS
jgi:drug/metabolite transporter (DMT)-like permease